MTDDERLEAFKNEYRKVALRYGFAVTATATVSPITVNEDSKE